LTAGLLEANVESVDRISQAEIRPEVHGGVVFSANSKSDDLRIGFASSDSSLNLDGLETGRARFQGGLGLKAQVTDAFDIGLTYELVARKGYRAHYGQIGLWGSPSDASLARPDALAASGLASCDGSVSSPPPFGEYSKKN
jgi:hypothetical protein